jgi:hypothetical protein
MLGVGVGDAIDIAGGRGVGSGVGAIAVTERSPLLSD